MSDQTPWEREGLTLTQMWAGVPSIDDLKALQARFNLCDVHIVWVGESWFVVAHTDEERATISLKDCELHRWLHDLSGPPEKTGYYVVTPHKVDAYSEPYPVARFDFTPLDLNEVSGADRAQPE